VPALAKTTQSSAGWEYFLLNGVWEEGGGEERKGSRSVCDLQRAMAAHKDKKHLLIWMRRADGIPVIARRKEGGGSHSKTVPKDRPGGENRALIGTNTIPPKKTGTRDEDPGKQKKICRYLAYRKNRPGKKAATRSMGQRAARRGGRAGRVIQRKQYFDHQTEKKSVAQAVPEKTIFECRPSEKLQINKQGTSVGIAAQPRPGSANGRGSICAKFGEEEYIATTRQNRKR